ncbi:MAG: hypothetical protein H0U75_04725 [Legionella sp.]|nr:hypothetical protein [Legionella sp.]
MASDEEVALHQFQENNNRIKRVQLLIKGMKQWRTKLDIIALLSNTSQITLGVIMFLIIGPIEGPKYLPPIDIILGFGKSLTVSLQGIVQIFAFVGYSGIAIRAVWDLGVTFYHYHYMDTANKIATLNPPYQSVTLPTKTNLIGRTLANIIMAVFNIVAVFTVLGGIGLISTGTGLLLAAIAAGIAWVKDSVIPWWRTRKAIKDLCLELQSLDESTLGTSVSSNQLDSQVVEFQRQQLNEQLANLRTESKTCFNSMLLNGVSSLAFSLYAVGSFGFFTVEFIGSVLLVACTVIGIGRIVYNSCKKPPESPVFLNTKALAKELDETGLEFHHRMKFHYWMEDTYTKLNAKFPKPPDKPILLEPISDIDEVKSYIEHSSPTETFEPDIDCPALGATNFY